MRLFVYEYTCAADLRKHPELAALRPEGQAMLTAVLQDFERVRGVEALTISDAHDEETAFRETAASADFSLIIAPESEDILLERCRWVEEAGGRLLGPSSAAVQLTGDKEALGEHWRSWGVPTPAVVEDPVFPAVCKPRFGAGSQATFLVRNQAELTAAFAQGRAEGFHGEWMVQPFVPGQPVSVAWLIGPRACVPLLPAEQTLSTDGRFHYLGGVLPLAPDLAQRAVRLSRLAVESVTGLRGYVSVDLVLGEHGTDWAIELNPRLTTSYIGLRVLARTNLADAMLRVVQGHDVPEPEWRPGRVRFEAGGQIIDLAAGGTPG